MRRSIAAVAVIRRETRGQGQWLAQWNDHWQCYNFVAGHKRPSESFRECAVREMEEELGLHERVDFTVPAEPRCQVEYTAWSERARAETRYTMALFDVRLCSDAARAKVDADPRNRWLAESEIRSQQASDGKRVSPTMQRPLADWGSGMRDEG